MFLLASSNELNIKQINQDIIYAFQNVSAIDKDSAIHVEKLNLKYPLKLQYYLIEEFVRNDFMEVLEDGRVFFKEKSTCMKKRKFKWFIWEY